MFMFTPALLTATMAAMPSPILASVLAAKVQTPITLQPMTTVIPALLVPA